MLTKEQKKEIVKDLTEKIKSSKSVVFANFKGVTVSDLTDLRKELRQSDAEFKVVKKTLLGIALKNADIDIDTRKIDGQIAVSISQSDEVAPARIINNFSKENENMKITGGVLEKKEMSIDEIMSLAKLPSKEELLAKLVGSLNAPISGFANVLRGNLKGLVQVLKAVADNKGN